jgi:hypothetical protein
MYCPLLHLYCPALYAGVMTETTAETAAALLHTHHLRTALCFPLYCLALYAQES